MDVTRANGKYTPELSRHAALAVSLLLSRNRRERRLVSGRKYVYEDKSMRRWHPPYTSRKEIHQLLFLVVMPLTIAHSSLPARAH